MPGVSNPGYVVLIQAAGEGDRHERHVQGDSEAVEFCLTTRGLRQQANYSVQVTVDTQLPVTTPAVELTFQKLGPGQCCVGTRLPCVIIVMITTTIDR